MGLEDDSSALAMTVAKFAILLVIGIALLSGVGSNNLLSTNSALSITLSGNPSDGDTLTTDGHVFEFDSNGSVVSGHTAVTIASQVNATQTNLHTALGTYYGVS
jgi:hypothetical protein